MGSARTVCVLCLVAFGCGALKLPDYIKPCSRTDPKFNECALQHAREAIPRIIQGDRKYGVPVLDPLVVERSMLTHSGITANTWNTTIVGVKDAVVEDIRVDFQKQIIKVAFAAPRVFFKGQYQMAGKIAGVPITGTGDYEMIMSGLRGNYTTNYTLTRLQDGELYSIPDTYDVDFDITDGKVHLGNLFNGNKLLGDATNEFINENWRLILEELGKPLFTALGGIVHQILLNVAQKVPYNELFAE